MILPYTGMCKRYKLLIQRKEYEILFFIYSEATTLLSNTGHSTCDIQYICPIYSHRIVNKWYVVFIFCKQFIFLAWNIFFFLSGFSSFFFQQSSKKPPNPRTTTKYKRNAFNNSKVQYVVKRLKDHCTLNGITQSNMDKR